MTHSRIYVLHHRPVVFASVTERKGSQNNTDYVQCTSGPSHSIPNYSEANLLSPLIVHRPLNDHMWNLKNINTIIRYACISYICKLTCEGPNQELPPWEWLVSFLRDFTQDFNSRGSWTRHLSSHPVSHLPLPLEVHLCAPKTPAINFTREIVSKICDCQKEQPEFSTSAWMEWVLRRVLQSNSFWVASTVMITLLLHQTHFWCLIRPES